MDERAETDNDASGRLPRFCGECGYRLEGLPAEGHCPECGAVYHPDRIVIAGWGIGPLESTSNAPPHRFARVVAVACVGFVLIAIFRFIKHHPDEGMLYLGWALLAGGFEWFGRWYRQAGEGPTCHARIFPEGFGQRNGFGKCKPIPWRTAGRVTLEPTSNGHYRLQISSNETIRTPVSIEFECRELQAVWLKEVIAGLGEGRQTG